ncbi:MAG TPA: hypothetical protein VL463_21665 [Kofleriaceae bacterium]|jgi:hypothetical protein|nr:hypothetical protein [Kofleriaceae bacterium]
MPILEEAVREENLGLSENELEEEAYEVQEAENVQALARDAYGGGLDHSTLMRYDHIAHQVAGSISGKKLHQAEEAIKAHWDPLHVMHYEDITALRALESIKGQVIAPVMQHLTKEARTHLEWHAMDLLKDGVVGEGKTRDAVKEDFCGKTSKDICGVEYHPVAVEVFEQMIAPLAKDPEPAAPQVQEVQQEKAEEQIEQEEEKAQA